MVRALPKISNWFSCLGWGISRSSEKNLKFDTKLLKPRNDCSNQFSIEGRNGNFYNTDFSWYTTPEQ